MRRTLLIAKREYLEQIHGRAFLFSTLALPLLVFALIGASYLNAPKQGMGRHVAIASNNAALAGEVRRQLLADGYIKFTVDVAAPTTEEERTALLKEVETKALDGLLAIDTADGSSAGAITASYTTRASLDEASGEGLRTAVNHAVVHERLIAGGMKPADAHAMQAYVAIKDFQLNKDGKVEKSVESGIYAKVTTMAFLISMPILLYGMNMARAIIEEKTSRIFEVMLAIAKPDDLLAGKLLGVGAVGLTQIVIWVGSATLFLSSALAASLLTGDFAFHFSWIEGVLFPVYFVLGFALFSALFSGLAATCETSQDLQMFGPLAAIPVWISFGMLTVLFKDPNSVWVVAASIFPFTSPYVMIPRMGLQMPPLWQFAASIGLLILSIWGVLWFSSRLYRVGILMYGKRATLPEIVRWLRYS
jgi:ABC-2 type transport system permease protein